MNIIFLYIIQPPQIRNLWVPKMGKALFSSFFYI
jgi:hypothetical protein